MNIQEKNQYIKKHNVYKYKSHMQGVTVYYSYTLEIGKRYIPEPQVNALINVLIS